MQNQLNEVNKMNSKLELQYHHATVLLKNEIKVRKQVSDEKKSLVNSNCHHTGFAKYLSFYLLQEKQLYIVREIVSAEKDIKDETREKLAMLSNTGRYSRGNFDSPGDRLNTINEMNSTGSLLASFDLTTERTEEELELSVMRSSRPARTKRTSEGCYNLDTSKRRKSNREVWSTNEPLLFPKQRYNVFVFKIWYKEHAGSVWSRASRYHNNCDCR